MFVRNGERIIASLAIAAAFCGSAGAATEWVRLTTPHFELITTAGEKKGRETIQYFETVRQFFIDSGMVKHAPATPVRIIGFRNEKEYRPYAVNQVATAYYAGGPEHDYIVMSTLSLEQYPVAVHEYVHLLVRHSGVTLPIWMNEGMAELFSTLQPYGKKVAFGMPIRGRIFEAREERFIDLRALTTAGHDSNLYNEKAHAGMFYDESWALMHMLCVTTEYRPKSGAFIKAVGGGQTAEAAFAAVYGKSIDEVQNELLRYIRGEDFKSLVASVQLDKSAEEPDVQPMDAWDANLALAEVMCSLAGQDQTGRRMLEQLTAEQPKRPEPWAMLGDLALRGRGMDDALGSYAKAAELGSKDAEMYLHYGILLHNHGSPQASLDALRKSADLNPANPETHFYLLFAYMDKGDYKMAMSEALQVKHLDPARAFSFYRATAYAEYRLGDAKQARDLATAARRFANTPADNAELDNLVDAIDKRDKPAAQGRLRELPATAAQTAEAEAVPVQTHLPRIEGTLEAVVCNGGTAQLELNAGGKTVRLLVDRPQAVRITNAGGGGVDFDCGKQKSRPVAVEYEEHPDSATKTIGRVRGIEFR